MVTETLFVNLPVSSLFAWEMAYDQIIIQFPSVQAITMKRKTPGNRSKIGHASRTVSVSIKF